LLKTPKDRERLEEIAEKSSSAVGDDDHIRLGDPLQARRKIGSVAHHPALLRITFSNEIADDHQPCGNANANLKRRIKTCAELQDTLDQRESAPYCPLCIVLMRLRVTEVVKHAIAHVLRDKPTGPGVGFIMRFDGVTIPCRSASVSLAKATSNSSRMPISHAMA
jgi:hypothetical protein